MLDNLILSVYLYNCPFIQLFVHSTNWERREHKEDQRNMQKNIQRASSLGCVSEVQGIHIML